MDNFQGYETSALPNQPDSTRNLRAEYDAAQIVAASLPRSVEVAGVVFRQTGWYFADGAPVYAGRTSSGLRHVRLERLRYLQRLFSQIDLSVLSV